MANALHAYFQYQLIENAHHGLALGATLYFNDVNNSPFERSSFEQAIQLNYSYRNKNHTLFSSLGYSFHDDSEAIFGSLLNDSTLAFSAGYAYRIFDNHELIAQYHIYEGALDDDSAFSDPSQEVVLGYRYTYNDWMALEVSATENVGNMDNSTDIHFTGGLRFYID
ncbi:hypothetical protein JCM19231_5613 [Vibrio ishigakensis]|uniref:Porin domain-containing protein n=2 Tax=Vibrio ishigakensis TaxID=1481914 RepID=A0A0B8P1T4_9VIBR|nr:hypothetical protein JCM19231_5613 [Vibrio ishigakensis]